MIVILGTAHGKNVGGKRSPDGNFLEYQYSRAIIGQLKNRLELDGVRVFVDIMESEVPLPQNAELAARAKFVNDLCDKHGTKNCIYVSIHVNAAASTGRWNKAGGWAAYTSRGNTAADDQYFFLFSCRLKIHAAFPLSSDQRIDGTAAGLCSTTFCHAHEAAQTFHDLILTIGHDFFRKERICQ